MMKIKVLHVIEQLHTTGGAERRLLNDLKYLNRKKIESSVFCIGYYDEKIFNKLSENFRVFCSSKNNILSDFFYLIKIINKLKPNIVHTQLFYSDILGRTAAKLCGVPIIVSTFHNSVYEPSVPYYYSRKRRFLDMITARFCTHFIAVSEFVKKSMSKRLFINPKKISVIYNYVEQPNIVQKTKNNKNTVLCCVGKLNPAKGQKELIEAISELIKKGKNLKLILVGDSSMKKEYELQVKKLNIEKNVVFTGNTNNVQKILNFSDAFIFPTHSEGLSLSLLEAVLSKKTCIISSIPSNLEVIDKTNCFVFEPKNKKEICSAISQFINTDQKKLKKNIENAYRTAKKKFNPKKQAGKLQKLYLKLYNKHEKRNT